MTEPARWHNDPTGRHELRYWDGVRWTEHVSDQGNVSTDPEHAQSSQSDTGSAAARIPVNQEAMDKAGATIERTGIVGERGVAVEEGFASSGASTFDDTVGMEIPGASLLASRTHRVVLVTDQNVYFFRGRRFDRPGAQLGAYRVGPGVMSYDGEKICFPDGQLVHLSFFQAHHLLNAAGLDFHASIAGEILKRAGIAGELGVTVATGIDPSTEKKTLAGRVTAATERISPVVDVGAALELFDESKAEPRIVLVTDQHLRLFRGDRLSDAGELVATYGVGVGSLLHDSDRLTFPDGQMVAFRNSNEARRIAAAWRGEIRNPIDRDHEWVHQPTLGGIYRLFDQRKPTTATALVDHGLPVASQIQALEALDWAPPTFVAPLIAALQAGTPNKPRKPHLPDGRLDHPFPSAYFSLLVDAGPATNPVARYLWPSLTTGWELSLDPGEELLYAWQPPSMWLSSYPQDRTQGSGDIMMRSTDDLSPRAYLTTRRVVVVGQRDPVKVAEDHKPPWWALHFRHEWTYEVGRFQSSVIHRPLFGGKRVAHTSEGFYARLYQHSGGRVIELSFPGEVDDPHVLRDLIHRSTRAILGADAGRAVRPEMNSTHEKMGLAVARAMAWIDGSVPYSLPSSF